VCRISAVSEDWVEKGCHFHVRGTEVVLRPDHRGGFVCRKFYRSTKDWEAEAACKLLHEQLRDPKWRRKLIRTIQGAMAFLLGVEGVHQSEARGRLRELRMLIVALERFGAS
jgi:hypothetical protein